MPDTDTDMEFYSTLAAELVAKELNNKLAIQNKKQVQIKTVTTITIAQ